MVDCTISARLLHSPWCFERIYNIAEDEPSHTPIMRVDTSSVFDNGYLCPQLRVLKSHCMMMMKMMRTGSGDANVPDCDGVEQSGL